MKKLLVSLLLLPSIAFGQTVQQAGQITPGHAVQWITNGIIGDGGVSGGPIFTGSTTVNDFACVGMSGTIIDCGLSATGTNAWTGLQNFNGGATAPTLAPGNSTTNVATTAFVGTAVSGVSVTNGDGTLTISPNTGAIIASIALGHANTWTASQNFSSGAAAPTRSVGDNTTNVATTAFVATNQVAVNPVFYGADPTGAADSAAGLNAALAVSSYVVFPPGHYKFLSQIGYTIPAGNHSVTIVGAGQDNTFLDWPSGNGINILFNSGASSAHVRDLTIETGTVNASNGLTYRLTVLDVLGAAASASDVENVTFRGNDSNGGTNAWANAVFINNVSNVSFINDFFFGAGTLAGNGVTAQGNTGLSSQAVVFNFVSCTFVDLGAGIVYGPAAQGLTVANSNFTSGTNGIFVTGAISPLTQLSVTGSQFATANDINLNSLVSSIHIVGNLFIQAASQNAITLASTQDAYIIGNNFAGGGASSNSGITIVATVANSTTEIIGNSFHSLATGINLSGASAAAIIANNDFFSNTNAILNSSTGVLNRIHDNVGYNPVGVTASANICASPCTITAGPSPETHYLRQSATNTATVTKGGQAVATLAGATTYYPFDLGPNESIIVTWATTNPTDTKDVH